MVQWLGLHASIAGGTGSIPVARELRSHKLCNKSKKKKDVEAEAWQGEVHNKWRS